MKRYSWKHRLTQGCLCCSDWMKDISSYFRLDVGYLIQFYLKLDMAKLFWLNKNYEWPSFGNHRYSHVPETVSQSHSHVPKTVSWHNSNSPTDCLNPPFYDDYRYDFVSRGFEETLINLTAIAVEIFEYLFRVTSITWNYVQQPCTWDIKA